MTHAELLLRLNQIKVDIDGDTACERRLLEELWQIASSPVAQLAAGRFEQDAELQELGAFFGPRWQRYIALLEYENRTDASRRSVLAREQYEELTSELGLIGKEASYIVVVGVGPYPETFLALHELTEGRSKLVGLDSDAGAVERARNLCEDLVLGPSVVCAKGEEFDYVGADAVMVMNGVRNKESVLARVEQTARQGVRVLVRSPISLGSLLYERVDAATFNGTWYVTATTRPSPLSESVMIVKQ